MQFRDPMAIADVPLTSEVKDGTCFEGLTVEEASWLRGSAHGLCGTPVSFLGLLPCIVSSIEPSGQLVLWSLDKGSPSDEDIPFHAHQDEVVVDGKWEARREIEARRWKRLDGCAQSAEVEAAIRRSSAHDAYKNAKTARQHFESWNEGENASAKLND